MTRDPDRHVGIESLKTYAEKCRSGFWDRYVTGPNVLDIGFKGHIEGHLPITETAIGIDLDYPGYDGVRLPFGDQTQDAIYSSHMLEHTPDPIPVIRDWWRVLKIGGHIITVVPHAYLYERKMTVPPSLWNGDHRRPYTPASLLREFETALTPNTYRVRHLCDQDTGYDYARKWDEHAHGCYEIEIVVQKIEPPEWNVQP